MAEKTQMRIEPTGGIDWSAAATAIPDNALLTAYNMWYDPASSRLTTRGGLEHEGMAKLAAGIVALHHFIRKDGTTSLVCASGSKLYKQNGTAWDEITVLATKHPSLQTFNAELFIADGGALLRKWTGTAVDDVTGSPSQANAIHEHANRLVCNSATDLDAVYFSGPEKADEWDTTSGTAVSIRCGFGDGYKVVGFASLYDNLIVSKMAYDADGNVAGRKLYAINTAGLPAQWSARLISSENGALFPSALAAVGQAVFMLDSDGFKAINPALNVQQGDLSVDTVVGSKINTELGTYAKNANHAHVVYMHSLAQVWLLTRVGDNYKLFLFHPIRGQWTQLEFAADFVPDVVAEVAGKVLIGGGNGELYSLVAKGSDEVMAGSDVPFWGVVKTKLLEAPVGEFLHRETSVQMDFLSKGEAFMEIRTSDMVTRYQLGEFIIPDSGGNIFLYDARMPLATATQQLGGGSTRGQQAFQSRGPRDYALAWQIRTKGARISLNSITATLELVGR